MILQNEHFKPVHNFVEKNKVQLSNFSQLGENKNGFDDKMPKEKKKLNEVKKDEKALFYLYNFTQYFLEKYEATNKR